MVWLFGLIAILNLFALTEVVAPIQDLLQRVLAALPGIVGAALIFFIGLVLARIVRQLVETSLRAAGADDWLRRSDASGAGSSETTAVPAGTTMPTLSRIAGQLVFALIVIVVSISALQVLGIEAIAEPATQMLTLILNAIPSVIAAALLLGIGYLISRFVGPLLESTLRGLGTDRALADLGAGGTRSTPPSRVIATIGQVAIVLFFAVAATRVLGFPEVTEILDTVLEVAGGIILGGAIIAVGVFVANLAPRFVSGRTGEVIRYAAIALFVAIGLGSMGLADSIVNLAFGALVVVGCCRRDRLRSGRPRRGRPPAPAARGAHRGRGHLDLGRERRAASPQSLRAIPGRRKRSRPERRPAGRRSVRPARGARLTEASGPSPSSARVRIDQGRGGVRWDDPRWSPARWTASIPV